MLAAFPVLVPLHWLAARDRGPVSTAAWALLASLSLFEAGWMLTYLATDHVVVSVAAGSLVALATTVAFLRRGAESAARRLRPA